MGAARPVSGEVLGIVAGGGALPRIVADAAIASGSYRSVAIVTVADGAHDDWSGFDARYFGWGRVGDAIAHMSRRGVGRLVVCGSVSRRPDFRSLVPSVRTLAILPSVLKIVRGGDDRLLKNLDRYLSSRGFTLIGVQDIVPELLAPAGVIGGRGPDEREMAALNLAARAADRLGGLDIGQAVVASAERVIAVEAIEGTRDMLQRVAELRRRGRIGRSEACVLVKAVKPDQDRRFDLPSIGISTIEEAAAAGLTAIGVSAGHSLILKVDDVVAAADARKMALVGLDLMSASSPQTLPPR